jgi:ketol-acid reductoisomerase
MRGAIPPLPHKPPWRGAPLKEEGCTRKESNHRKIATQRDMIKRSKVMTEVTAKSDAKQISEIQKGTSEKSEANSARNPQVEVSGDRTQFDENHAITNEKHLSINGQPARRK